MPNTPQEGVVAKPFILDQITYGYHTNNTTSTFPALAHLPDRKPLSQLFLAGTDLSNNFLQQFSTLWYINITKSPGAPVMKTQVMIIIEAEPPGAFH
jgi:hypothetical protein